MDGDVPGDAVPEKKRSHLQKRKRVHGEGNVAEETRETITPEWVLEKMVDFEGYDPREIMELKELKASDVDSYQGRLLLPKQVDRSFLNDGERETLAAVPKKGVCSLFIGIEGEEYDLELREWKNGLVLTKGWGNVTDKEGFEIGAKYPLWCFRSRNKNDKLCFTLVNTNQVEQVLPNVDNEDEELSGPNDTEEEEVAKKNDSFSHPPDSPDCDISHLDEDKYYLPTEAESKSFYDDLAAFHRDHSA